MLGQLSKALTYRKIVLLVGIEPETLLQQCLGALQAVVTAW